MNNLKSILVCLLALSFFTPYNLLAQSGHAGHQHEEKVKDEAPSFWTCSMHPQIKLQEAGKCPICGMNLIPVTVDRETDSSSGEIVTLKLSKVAQSLADIQTSRVERKPVQKELRLVGNIDYDETRLTHITAWVPGRIDRMFVDYTGITVNKGDHMLEMYSPELITAQEELIQATRSLKKLQGSSSALVRESTERSAKSAEEKLLLLGLTSEQVRNIKNRGKAEDSVTIYSPTGGVVVERSATEGMYVQEGTRIYSIADLSTLWVYLDAYETDLPWIRYGQKVEFTTKALPGATFEGTVSFVSPIVNSETRTTRVRVNIDNSKGLLKPGLFVKGIIHADVFGEGKVVNTSLKGKFIGPMHPEVIQDRPGKCPICEMDLVPAEKLGYVTEETESELPLIIPASAPLITGKRAVVYVKRADTQVFEARNVVLGPEASGNYVVIDGLKENELVVTKGAFKIDADLQIRGRTSMMNPEGAVSPPVHEHGVSVERRDKSPERQKAVLSNNDKDFLSSYLDASEALASDDMKKASTAFGKIKKIAKDTSFETLRTFLQEHSDDHEDISNQRKEFGLLSALLIEELESFALEQDQKAFKAHCPMALGGKGAYWLQREKAIRNPYFGSSMLGCGSLVEGR